MNRNRASVFALFTLFTFAVQGCGQTGPPTAVAGRRVTAATTMVAGESGRYVVVFAAERVPPDFQERLSALGGSVEAALEQIGVATVSGLSASAAVEIAAEEDVRAVERDLVMNMSNAEDTASDELTEAAMAPITPADALASPTSAQFYARQWNMRAVFAPEAWAAGQRGSRDVVVAILDTGIDYLHPDLVGLVDLQRSTSFVPEEDPLVAQLFPGRLPFSDLFWHGTAVASTVASNAKILAGVNQNVTLIAVKIFDRSYKGPVGRLLAGIVYAADQGADVINVSGGYDRDKSDNPGMVAAFERAANYAFQKGALIVSLPFNDAADLDHDGDRVRFPCEAAHVLCVSATGPTTATSLTGPWTDVDAPAPYSGFGRSAVDVAAPGGGGALGVSIPFSRVWVDCTTTWTETTEPNACRRPECRLLSAPRPSGRDCIGQGQGTTFATATATGLAAMLTSQLGHGNPALIRARILQSADDLGQPGLDPYYGHGRINIARALGVIH